MGLFHILHILGCKVRSYYQLAVPATMRGGQSATVSVSADLMLHCQEGKDLYFPLKCSRVEV